MDDNDLHNRVERQQLLVSGLKENEARFDHIFVLGKSFEVNIKVSDYWGVATPLSSIVLYVDFNEILNKARWAAFYSIVSRQKFPINLQTTNGLTVRQNTRNPAENLSYKNYSPQVKV